MEEEEQQQQHFQINDELVNLIVIGMAGSGKTTFIQQFAQKNLAQEKPDFTYIANLDPAVQFLPYTPNYDIRDQIKYKDIMKKHNLGPNGAIMTSLNLFCTQIDQFMDSLDAQIKSKTSEYVVVDTPGQLEVFTWSASGTIITQALSSSCPTVLLYVLDMARCQNPNSFVSNMIFCSSIFYQMQMPMVIIFNKEDVGDKETLKEWMEDYDQLLDALNTDKSYLATLNKSMVMAIDEFYSKLNYVCVSSKTGTGFDELYVAISKAKKEFMDVTLVDMENQIQYKQQFQKEKEEIELEKFMKEFQLKEEESLKQPRDPPVMVNVFNVGGNEQKKKVFNKMENENEK